MRKKLNDYGEETIIYRFTLEFTNATNLRGREVTEVASMKTAKNIDDARFKEDGGFRVDEMKSGSGTPSSDPVKGSFQ